MTAMRPMPGIAESDPQANHVPTMEQPSGRGSLIINADDWGIDPLTTDRILDCVTSHTVSSVSAMVFMEDSERAADLALQRNVDTGLHLNLSAAFTGAGVSPELGERHRRLISYLRGRRYARAIYHPGLAACFEYVVRVQMDEYERLYGTAPRRIDGHHHLHLCANVQRQKLLPGGIVVRRNFSLEPGEKSLINRLYRARQDRRLVRRHRLTDYFFSLSPLDPSARLVRIFALAQDAVVEVETHPVNTNEYLFLTTGWTGHRQIEPYIAGNYTIACA